MKKYFCGKMLIVVLVFVLFTISGCTNNSSNIERKEAVVQKGASVNYISLFTEKGNYTGKIILPSVIGGDNDIRVIGYGARAVLSIRTYLYQNNLSYDWPIVVYYENFMNYSDDNKIFYWGEPCNIEDSSVFIPTGYKCNEWSRSSNVVYAFIHDGVAEHKGIYFLWREKANNTGEEEYNALRFLAGELNVSNTSKDICLNALLNEVACLN